MEFILKITFIAGAIAFLGKILDDFFLPRNKVYIHIKLLQFWNWIDDIVLPNVYMEISRKVVSRVQKIFSKESQSFMTLVWLLLGSWFITSLAYWVGIFCEVYFRNRELDFSVLGFPYYPLYFVNISFDSLAMLFFYRAMCNISFSGYMRATVVLILQGMLAFGLMYLTMMALIIAMGFSIQESAMTKTWGSIASQPSQEDVVEKLNSLTWFEEMLKKRDMDFEFTRDATISTEPSTLPVFHYAYSYAAMISLMDLFTKPLSTKPIKVGVEVYKVSAKEGVVQINDYGWVSSFSLDFRLVFMSLTVFIPTMFFILVLFFSIISKFLLEVWKKSALYFLELATLNDPAIDSKNFRPWSLVGMVFSLISVIANLSLKLLE